MRRLAWIAFAIVIVTVLALTYCRPSGTRVQPRPTAAKTVDAWMLCQECDGGELAKVKTLGDSAVPFLRSLLLDGPPVKRVQRVEQYLKPLASSRNPHPATQATLDEVRDDYVAGHRMRAAIALGVIGGGSARDALCEGRRRNFSRANVRSAIEDALVKMHGTCP